ncbi:sigma-70 family RNA polymerase sigma factor [Oceanobacillus alkalisoli]|uniref:sigma-70 family RNA polymerase sigma factor n=1 Tax=Oceanobacillus alkalisoli TaxID=2925113 RepID=UPI001EE3B81B|nr:sigma-70 family RNA polymerase sigma factor [Oceanobacillus alkalisoli]MCG5102581.1 sigma-70 family RNA polymerase sigma factor [Oceanobacillus alkalisoli]
MTDQKHLTFEEIFKQNERRIHYHIHRLGIRDPYQDFYSEGLFALWTAHQKYNPNKGPLGTYFNYTIRNRLVDLLRKETREMEKKDSIVETEKQRISDATTELRNTTIDMPGSKLEEREMWQDVKAELTAKQWDWVYYYIIQGMRVKEIAEMKGVSVEAVKGWGKGARRKLRKWAARKHPNRPK